MRKLITFIVVAMLLQSCDAIKQSALKGDYKKPNTFYFDKTESEVYASVLRVVMNNGFSIIQSDKLSGAIHGNKMNFYKVSTYEDEKGLLVDKDAYIVTEKFYDGMSYHVPANISADWNALVYRENGKTLLRINLVNIEARPNLVGAFPIYYKAVSTGNFEKLIADSLIF